MGRAAAFTQEQVFEVADRLAANGQDVTPNAIRDVLGRGSYSTFIKHIDAWQAQRQAAPAPVVIDMPEAVKSAFAQCWQAATNEAGKEIAAIREKSEAEITAMQRRLDDAIGAIEQLEQEAEADEEKREAVSKELADERGASQQSAREFAAREASLLATVAEHQKQIDSGHADLARLHEDVNGARSRLAEQAALLQAVKEDAERLRAQLVDAGRIREEASARERAKIEEAAAAKADAAQARLQIATQEKRMSELLADVAAVRAESAEAAAKFHHAAGELDALRAQIAAASAGEGKQTPAASVKKPTQEGSTTTSTKKSTPPGEGK